MNVFELYETPRSMVDAFVMRVFLCVSGVHHSQFQDDANEFSNVQTENKKKTQTKIDSRAQNLLPMPRMHVISSTKQNISAFLMRMSIG